MKKILLLIVAFVLCSQTIKAQVVLDANGVTIKWTGTTVPSPYFVQASPRGTLEWFAIVNDSTKSNITSYAQNNSTGIIYFTLPGGGSARIPFNNMVTTLVTDMSGMFGNANTFNKPIGSWDLSNVNNMDQMFNGATSFNQPIGSWNVSNDTSMNYMFNAATSFNQPLGSWNVSKVTSMSYMFSSASSFNQPVENWNVSKVTNMSSMFENANVFNQPLENWNVSKVTNMNYMFGNATSFNQNINSWNVSNVTNMNNMFSNATAFNQPIGNWDVSNLTNMGGMFRQATSFNQPISSWNVSNVTNMRNVFNGATSFNQNIGYWNVSNATDMTNMFINGAGLSIANYDSLLIGWSTITSAETPLKLGVTFGAGNSKYCNGASARDSIINTYVWTITDGGLDCSIPNPNQIILDVNGITIKWTGSSVPSPYFVQASPRGTLEWFAIVNEGNKSNISDYAQQVTSGITYFTPPGSSTPIPFNNIVTSNVTDMSYMFRGATTFNQNINSWDVSNVTNMNNTFSETDSFNQNIGSWNVSKVIYMPSMFRRASSFNQNIGSWNVSNVTNISTMFVFATSFNQNIGSWNVSNVTNMSNMFFEAGLSTANYDSLLIGWSAITSSETPLKQGISFDAGSSKYCNGASARDSIISKYKWTITDGGLDCSVLGVEEFETNNIKIYPNPTNNIINIEGLNKNENNTIQIFDVQGKLVITKTINEKGTIDLSELNKGVYVIKIGDVAQRIVKM
jgi:surface protein